MIIGSKLLYYKTLTSTNTKALLFLKNEDLPEGTVIHTAFQTSGKGQAGRRWESEEGKNLLLSIILYPESVIPEKQFIISVVISLGICDLLDRYHPDCRIKWPNDIYIKNNKIAGILIENSVSGSTIKSSVAGIGLNINQFIFPEDIPNPTSLKLATGKEYDTATVMKELLSDLDIRYKQMLYGSWEGLREEYITRLYMLNKWGTYKSSARIFNGKITGVSEQGQIIIEDRKGKIEQFSFREIHYVS
ncbi:MAG: biotin--[acetyl-CoA-carboxylase] ligase [Bacteroidales bacterium]|nr:biotin--[acetyl-CoA-carboxylase] ligase [Bacteroidales bacterium]